MFSTIQTSLLNSIHFFVGWLLTFVFSLLSMVINASPLESSPTLVKQSRGRGVRSLFVSSDASSRSSVISSIFSSDFDALSSPSSSGLSTPTSFISCPLPSSYDLNKALNKLINASSQAHISSAVVKYQPTSTRVRTSRTFVYASSSKTYQVGLSRRETSLHI